MLLQQSHLMDGNSYSGECGLFEQTEEYPGEAVWLSYYDKRSWCCWLYHGWIWLWRASGVDLCEKQYSTHHARQVIWSCNQGQYSPLCSYQTPHSYSCLQCDSPTQFKGRKSWSLVWKPRPDDRKSQWDWWRFGAVNTGIFSLWWPFNRMNFSLATIKYNSDP